MKHTPGIPVEYRRHVDRVTKELRRDNIHEFTGLELSKGIHRRGVKRPLHPEFKIYRTERRATDPTTLPR